MKKNINTAIKAATVTPPSGIKELDGLTDKQPTPSTTETPEQRVERLRIELAEAQREVDTENSRRYAERVKALAGHATNYRVSLDDIKYFQDHGTVPAVWPSQMPKPARGTRSAEPKVSKGKTTTQIYMNPANPSETWSGKGKAPGWIAPFDITPAGQTKRAYKPETHIKPV